MDVSVRRAALSVGRQHHLRRLRHRVRGVEWRPAADGSALLLAPSRLDLLPTLRYVTPGNPDDRTVAQVRTSRSVAPGATARFRIEWTARIPHGHVGRAGWVHDYNFIYANYYITDCDARSGAHAMILTSHRDKPISWLLGSVRKDREALMRYYGEGNEIVMRSVT